MLKESIVKSLSVAAIEWQNALKRGDNSLAFRIQMDIRMLEQQLIILNEIDEEKRSKNTANKKENE